MGQQGTWLMAAICVASGPMSRDFAEGGLQQDQAVSAELSAMLLLEGLCLFEADLP